MSKKTKYLADSTNLNWLGLSMSRNRKSAAKPLSPQGYGEGSETIPRKGSTGAAQPLEMVDGESCNILDNRRIPTKKGVYAIKCNTTEQCYIGAATSIRLRIARHLSVLKKGVHHSTKLQTAFQEYGIQDFSIEVIELIEEGDVSLRESFWMEKRNTVEKGFNMTTVCINYRKFSLSTDQIRKAVEPKCKSVMMFDLKGVYVCTFDSLTHAAKHVGTSTTNISGVCSGRLGYMKGHVFTYTKNYDSSKSYEYKKKPIVFTDAHREKISKALVGKSQSKAHRDKLAKIQGKSITRIEFSCGRSTVYPSIGECCRKNEMDPKQLHRFIKQQTSLAGFIFKFTEDIVRS